MIHARGYVVLVVLLAATATGCALNTYRDHGILPLSGLQAPVQVLRDEKGMAYIHAGSLDDALLAQGFVTSQDRLFQMELTRLLAAGRISELVGEKGRAMDVRMRTIGIARQAARHAAMLSPTARRFFERYVQGANQFIATRPEDYPLEFRLAGLRPAPWTVPDALTVLYFMGWSTSANLNSEVIAQMLVDRLGPQRAGELLPLNINPDRPGRNAARTKAPIAAPPLGLRPDGALAGYLADLPLAVGSNNWVVDGPHSAGGKPIVANDPHLEVSMLPGPFYPVGLITPQIRAVGAQIPGIPGISIGRTAQVALGITNAYGDIQDLCVERVDPNDPGRYLEGDHSLPFETLTETLLIRDKKAPDGMRRETIIIRSTRRGPVVSEVIEGLATDKVLTLRWSPFEAMGPEPGLDRIITARSAAELRAALAQITPVMLNFVYADRDGEIGWFVSGRLPIRRQGDGALPYDVSDGQDQWTGWVPADRMPQDRNPARGWIGTCNHYTVGEDFPYYYSSYAAHSGRYRRLRDLLDTPGRKAAEDHWGFQQDIYNPVGARLAPIMAAALTADPRTAPLGAVLAQWDYLDRAESPAPLVFQSVYRHFARRILIDELGPELSATLLTNWYFWQERIEEMTVAGTAAWFDDTTTPAVVETRDDLLRLAGLDALAELSADLGPRPDKWRWGDLHRLTLVSPIRRQGFGRDLLGAGSHAVAGSGDTLRRNRYEFNRPYQVKVAATLRMVADLGDDEKLLAVLPGGASGRFFHPHYKDQATSYLDGTPVFWWFSEAAIRAHVHRTLELLPN